MIIFNAKNKKVLIEKNDLSISVQHTFNEFRDIHCISIVNLYYICSIICIIPTCYLYIFFSSAYHGYLIYRFYSVSFAFVTRIYRNVMQFNAADNYTK